MRKNVVLSVCLTAVVSLLFLIGCPPPITDPIQIIFRYDANGGSGEMADQLWSSDMSDLENFKLTPNLFTRPGWVFTSWNTEPDGSGYAFEDGAVFKYENDMGEGVRTLYAQWEPASVSDLAAAPADRSVVLTWTLPDGAEGVKVSYSRDEKSSQPVTLIPAVSTYTFDNLENGIEYTFSVITMTGGKESQAAAVTATPSIQEAEDDPSVVDPGEEDKPEPTKKFDLTAGTPDFKQDVLKLPFTLGDGFQMPSNVRLSVAVKKDGGESVPVNGGGIAGTEIRIPSNLLTAHEGTPDIDVTFSADDYFDLTLTYTDVLIDILPVVTVTQVGPDGLIVGGESVEVTFTTLPENEAIVLKGVSIDNSKGTVSKGDGNTWTITVPDVDTEGTKTLLFTYGKNLENGIDIGTTTASVQRDNVCPSSTHVRYDSKVFKLVQGFDFRNNHEPDGAKIFYRDKGTEGWHAGATGGSVDAGYAQTNGDGSSFTMYELDRLWEFASVDGFTLMMVDWKVSLSSATPNVIVHSRESYGFTFFNIHSDAAKTDKQSFWLLNSWNPGAEGTYWNNLSQVTQTNFTKSYVYDNGSERSARVNNGDVHHFTLPEGTTTKLDDLSPLMLEFSGGQNGRATVRTVNFYIEAE